LKYGDLTNKEDKTEALRETCKKELKEAKNLIKKIISTVFFPNKEKKV